MSPPPQNSVNHAVEFLKEAGALTEREEQLTNLGRALAQLPVHPLLGKMLFAAACFGVLDSVATIAAGLSVKSPFVNPDEEDKSLARVIRANLDGGDFSDHLSLVTLFNGWISSGKSAKYAYDWFADQTVLHSLHRTRNQLMGLVLRSPLMARCGNRATSTASRYGTNKGLVRLVLLWSLYPHIATFEYSFNNKALQLVSWQGQRCRTMRSSCAADVKSRDLFDTLAVISFEQIVLHGQLTLMDATCLSPIDLALCVRSLEVMPLQDVPLEQLEDDDSGFAAAFPLKGHERFSDGYTALSYDRGKKLFVTDDAFARVLQLGRECMDYYLALAIKQLRADAFPDRLIYLLAISVGKPLEGVAPPVETTTAPACGSSSDHTGRGASTTGATTVGGEALTVEALSVLTAEQQGRIREAFGDLAVIRRAGIEPSEPSLSSWHYTDETEDGAGSGGPSVCINDETEEEL